MYYMPKRRIQKKTHNQTLRGFTNVICSTSQAIGFFGTHQQSQQRGRTRRCCSQVMLKISSKTCERPNIVTKSCLQSAPLTVAGAVRSVSHTWRHIHQAPSHQTFWAPTTKRPKPLAQGVQSCPALRSALSGASPAAPPGPTGNRCAAARRRRPPRRASEGGRWCWRGRWYPRP